MNAGTTCTTVCVKAVYFSRSSPHVRLAPRARLAFASVRLKYAAKLITPVLQAKQVHVRLLSTFQRLATKHSLVSFQSPTKFNFMEQFKVIIASREHLKFDVVNWKEKERMTGEISLSRDLIHIKARNYRCVFWNRTCLSLFVASRTSLKLHTFFFSKFELPS